MLSRTQTAREVLACALAGFVLLAPQVGAKTEYGAATSGPAISGMQRITGSGPQISITDAPWQVRLIMDGSGICGGAILDSQHIVTAAHCTYDGLSPYATSKIVVVSGSSSFDPEHLSTPNGPQPPDSPVSSSVASIRRHPGYVPSADGMTDAQHGRDDVAVLTLTMPLSLDGVVRRAIALPPHNAELPVGTTLSVTGYGLQQESPQLLDGKLHRLSDMTVLDPWQSVGEWNAWYVPATSASGLICSGDSGGPLVQSTSSGPLLVGLVSFTPNCKPGTASVHTATAAGEIREFILGNDSPPSAPAGGADVLLTADQNSALPLRPGRVLSCAPGTWTGSPAITVAFFDTSGAELQNGTSSSYTITTSDVGRRIGCRSRAETTGGVGYSPPTTTPPAVEALPAAAGPPNTTGGVDSLTYSFRVKHTKIKRGKSVGVLMAVTPKTSSSSVKAQACLTVPRSWKVMSRGKAKLSGRTLCVKSAAMKSGKKLTTTVSLRPGPSAKKGKTSLTLRLVAGKARRTVSKSIRVS